MSDPKFVVSQFKNRNGATSWRVSGWLAGVRIRKNFKTRMQAAAEKGTLEIRAVQLASGLRVASTFLEDEQLREAEAAFRRLKGLPRSLSFYLDYGIANYRDPAPSKPLMDAVEAYVATKQREHDRDLLSACQLRSIRKELAVLHSHFPEGVLSDLTPTVLSAFCERNGGSLKTCNNRRGILSTFFKFAFQNDWIPANPIEKVSHHRIAHRRGTAKTLSARRAAELMEYLEGLEGGALVPFFALCLFAGIRPCVRSGEIVKLSPEDIRLDTSVIRVEPEVSKVRMKRNVTIQPNLAAWLRAYPVEKFPIIPRNIRDRRASIARKFNLSHDVMRHTFISMFVAKFRSIAEAALQAGNSESIIRKHYLDLKTREEGEAFFSIMPKLNQCAKDLVESAAEHASMPEPLESGSGPAEALVAV